MTARLVKTESMAAMGQQESVGRGLLLLGPEDLAIIYIGQPAALSEQTMRGVSAIWREKCRSGNVQVRPCSVHAAEMLLCYDPSCGRQGRRSTFDKGARRLVQTLDEVPRRRRHMRGIAIHARYATVWCIGTRRHSSGPRAPAGYGWMLGTASLVNMSSRPYHVRGGRKSLPGDTGAGLTIFLIPRSLGPDAAHELA